VLNWLSILCGFSGLGSGEEVSSSAPGEEGKGGVFYAAPKVEGRGGKGEYSMLLRAGGGREEEGKVFYPDSVGVGEGGKRREYSMKPSGREEGGVRGRILRCFNGQGDGGRGGSVL